MYYAVVECNQVIEEISPEYSLEGLMLKLKLQYFAHLIQRTDSLEKILNQRSSYLNKGGKKKFGCPALFPGLHFVFLLRFFSKENVSSVVLPRSIVF